MLILILSFLSVHLDRAFYLTIKHDGTSSDSVEHCILLGEELLNILPFSLEYVDVRLGEGPRYGLYGLIKELLDALEHHRITIMKYGMCRVVGDNSCPRIVE